MAEPSRAQSLVEAAAEAHDEANDAWRRLSEPIRTTRARYMAAAVLEALCKRASPDIQRQLIDLADEIRGLA